MKKQMRAAANFRASVILLMVSGSILWVIRRFTKKARV